MNGATQRAAADLRSGTDESLYRVFDELQGELRASVRRVRGGAHGDSLRTTELFNEAYLKLFRRGAGRAADQRSGALDPQHLLAMWSNAAKWVTIELRRRRGLRTGRECVGDALLPDFIWDQRFDGADDEAVGRVFDELKAALPKEGLAAELKFLGGLPTSDIALCLEASETSVRRWLRAARLWIRMFVDGTDIPAGRDRDAEGSR